MIVYVVYYPYGDEIVGVYESGKNAYKTALEMSHNDTDYKVLEAEVKKPEQKEVIE